MLKIFYKSQLGYKNVEHIYVLELGMEINEGLFLIQDDNEIRNVPSKINSDTNVLEFFANHEIDAPIFAQDMLTISYKMNPPIGESRPIENDVQFLNVNEVTEGYEVFYHAFMENEGIESNEFKIDDVG